ncbi:MAG TPA: ATP-binding protein [Capsulimonadaceae bacterium]|nr:ATP-binding protein [Capsulimonadaceae bacterium]
MPAHLLPKFKPGEAAWTTNKMIRDLLELNNEFLPVRAMSDRPGWRDEAIDKALHAAIHYGEGEHLMASEIRRHCLGCTLVKVWPDRKQALLFLEEKTSEMRSLLAGSGFERDSNEELVPHFAWVGVVWKDVPIEVVFAPTSGYKEEVICFGWDQAAVCAFANALAEYANRPIGRCLRYTGGWENCPSLEKEIGTVGWDDIILAPELLADIRDAVEGFSRHKDSFRALGFPWKRGILLVGPPGTGKTMICKAAGATAPEWAFLYVRSLRGTCPRDHIRAIFQRARKVAPAILVFEDMDGFINKENRTEFLNEMDGFQSNDGLLIIASSNHPGKIDEALLKRPSRFDRVFHIGLPADAERREYCRRILSGPSLADRMDSALDVDNLAGKVAEASEGFTPAYLKEALISGALSRAQAGAILLDERFAEAVLAQVAELKAHLRRMKKPDALGEMLSGDESIGFRRD